MAEELTSVYDLPPDEHLVAATQAWLQSNGSVGSARSLNVQVASNCLFLRSAVRSAEDDP